MPDGAIVYTQDDPSQKQQIRVVGSTESHRDNLPK